MKLNILAISSAFLCAGTVNASLSTSYTFTGNSNTSVDACGSNNSNPVCSISAVIPSGSTIQSAFLYSSMWEAAVVPTISFNGQIYSGAAWTDLRTNVFLNAYRTDVTAQISAAVGGGSDVPFSFTIDYESPSSSDSFPSLSSIDGEILAIVYSNPREPLRTITFMDGFSASTGDSATLNLANPITAANLADPNFEATLALGIGFGYQASGNTSQSTTVRINNSVITTCAGGQDDGGGGSGLITVGGIGDSSNNPLCDNSGPYQDDEFYNLKPFLAAGDASIRIETLNRSLDDNLFFTAVTISELRAVIPPTTPPATVNEPATSVMIGLGLFGLTMIRRKNKS